jgi:hypothetical protein
MPPGVPIEQDKAGGAVHLTSRQAALFCPIRFVKEGGTA